MTTLPLLRAVELVQAPDVVAEMIVQLMPPVPVTVPLPVLPLAFTVTVVELKFAVTNWAEFIVTVQGTAVPVQPPLQPVNAVPAGAVGVSETEVP